MLKVDTDTLLHILDHDDPGSLLLVLLALLCISRLLANEQHQEWSYRLAAVAFLAYAYHRWTTYPPLTADDLLDTVLRTGLTAGLALACASVLLPPVAYVYRSTWGRCWFCLRRWYLLRRDRMPISPPQEPPTEAATALEPPVDRDQQIQQAIAQARQDYDNTCRLIHGLGLDQDETEAALLEARQRLLRRLRELLP